MQLRNPDQPFENLYLKDAVELFKYLCTKLNTFTQQKNNLFTTLVLQLIRGILAKPGQTLLSTQAFVDVIKMQLFDGLYANCLNRQKPIFVFSQEIFVYLVNNYRQHLKKEIAMFIHSISVPILLSGNSFFGHKD